MGSVGEFMMICKFLVVLVLVPIFGGSCSDAKFEEDEDENEDEDD